jgi:glucan endo-1,3-beta-D-glucosidase
MRSGGLVALAATISTATAAYQGFNYGSTFTNGAAKQEADFEAEFKNAQGLIGAPGVFNSARLYTTIQAGTSNTPISAIQAAINTKTSLLLGLWASAGDAVISNEIQALLSAIEQYGTDFTSLVAGISVGSEDLYRISPTGLLNKENPGADPATIAGYIKQVRDAIASTSLSGAPIGHVDTWTAWVNGSNQAVIDAADWIGVDAYPYFETTLTNDITNNKNLFNDALSQTKAAVGGKPVWITETGFPVSGKTAGLAVPSLENAKTYWDEVGCALFGNVNTWWYTMQDASPDTPNPSFGIVGNPLTTTPLFDLSCSNTNNTSSSSSSSAVASATGSSSAVASSASSAASSATGGASGSFTTVSVPTSLAGGSPGVGSGLPGSQSSLETSVISSLATSTANASGVQATATGTGVGSGSGATTTVGSGFNSTGTAGSGSSPTPTSTSVPVTANGAGALTGSVAAGFLAVFAAALAL